MKTKEIMNNEGFFNKPDFKPFRSYIVCATGRSGSTLLCRSLAQTGVCGNPKEYFPPEYIAMATKEQGIKDLDNYLNLILKKGTTQNGTFGMKIFNLELRSLIKLAKRVPMYSNLKDKGLEVINKIFPNLKYIYLFRRDVVRQAISFVIASKTKIWTMKPEEEFTKREVKYDFLSIYFWHHMLIAQNEAWREFFRENNLRPLEITYEQLDSSYEETIHRVIDYLGADVKDIPAKATKKMYGEINELWYKRYTNTPKIMIPLYKPINYLKRVLYGS